MPAGLIEEQDCVCSGADLGRDLIEMELHGFAVAGWQHQRGSCPKLGTDRTEQIGRLGALIVNGARARTLSGPAIGQRGLLADAHLVLAPHFYRYARRKLSADLRRAGGKDCLNASIASVSCLYALGRALTCENPSSLKAR